MTPNPNAKVVGGLYITLRKPLPLRRYDGGGGNMYLVDHNINRNDTVLVLSNWVNSRGVEFVQVLHENQTFYIESDSIGFAV